MDNVLFIPTMSFSILSLQKLVDARYLPVFGEIPNEVVIKKTLQSGQLEKIALMTVLRGRLTLDCTLAIPSLATTPSVYVSEITMSLLHRRLGHSGQPAIQQLLNESLATGIKLIKGSSISPCDDCQMGKLTRPSHPSCPFQHNTTAPLQLVVMDLAGPVRPRSLGGATYILNLFDIFTRFSWTIVLKAKSEASTKIKEWIPVAERQAGTKLQVIRSDNGGEFLPLAFISWLKLQGVTQQTTPPRSPESNGLAERLNRTLQDKCRKMMVAAKVTGYLWAEFYDAANTLRNLTPVTNLPSTPLEMWAGSKPDLSKLRVLGCKAFCQIDKS